MKSIKMAYKYTEGELSLCASKFWGNPDLPKTFSFPTYKDAEGGESHYDFVCQIRCSDLVPFDTEGRLPHKGMLYFFAQIGYYLGDIFFCDPLPGGMWPKDGVKVFYYPKEDWENFQSLVLLDDDDEEVALREAAISFSSFEEGQNCSGAADGHKLLGAPAYLSDEIDFEKYTLLLQLDSCELDDGAELNFMDCGMLYFLIPREDIGKPSFKNVRGYLASS